jgi:hypothetical protein
MRHTRWIAGILMVAAAAGCGCAGGAAGVVKHEGRPAGNIAMPLKGVYRATIIPPFDFIGPISGRISAEPTENGFIASTRPGIAWDMIGGVQGFLGSIFAPFVFPGGTIGTWTSTVPSEGSPGDGWFGVGGIKSAGVRTRITSSSKPVELVTDRRKVGLLLLEPDSPGGGPIRDYQGLADDIATAMTNRLYDPSVAKSSAIRAYINQVRYNSTIARDDVEFIFGTVAAARNHIKFTMPLAFPKGDPASRAAMTDWTASELTTIRSSIDRRTGLAWIRVDAFLSAADVDRVFTEIISRNPKALIIDVRSTPGVSLASLRVLSWLCEDTIDAGVWFGASRRDEVLAATSEVHDMVLASAASVEEIESALDSRGAVRVLIKPESGRFTGPVAILTSKRTSASAEPMVLALKTCKRAEVFGQPTSGRPFLSRPIDIRDGWVYWLAAADHRPTTGDRIPATGIRPDVETSSRESASKAAEKRLFDLLGSTPPKDPLEEGGSLLSPFFKAAGHGERK